MTTVASAPTLPTELRMSYNPPAPLPGQGYHVISVRFGGTEQAPTVDSVHVERGKVTYITRSTNWTFRPGTPDAGGFGSRLEARTDELVDAVRQLATTAPTGDTRSWPRNNDFTVRLGEYGANGVWEGKLIGGRDAADAVAKLLVGIAGDAKASLPSFTEGPG